MQQGIRISFFLADSQAAAPEVCFIGFGGGVTSQAQAPVSRGRRGQRRSGPRRPRGTCGLASLVPRRKLLREADRNLEGTYLVRLFPAYEAALGSYDRRARGGGAPLMSRGGRQGIGHRSVFPGGLLTTAPPVGYLKPITGWFLRLAMARCAAPCDWF